MAYTATLAARLSQLGATSVEFNLVDGAGAMPRARASLQFPTLTPTPTQIANAGTQAATRAEQDYLDREQMRGDRQACLESFKDWMDDQVAAANAAFQTRITNSNLSTRRKALARQASFNWSF